MVLFYYFFVVNIYFRFHVVFTNSVSEIEVALPPIGDGSQYSPQVIQPLNLNQWIMFWCKNTNINGTYRDRIWRAESWDKGKTWNNLSVVISGDNINANDDLSCSCGVAINYEADIWYMYYIGANRNTSMTLYLYHAQSISPGLKWNKMGLVKGNFPQPTPYYIETPTPYFIESVLYLFMVGGNNRNIVMSKTLNNNQSTMSYPQIISSPNWATHGRVTYINSTKCIYAYSMCSENESVPTELWMTESTSCFDFDPNTYTPVNVLMCKDSGNQYDQIACWSPFVSIANNLYFAGTGYVPPNNWWGWNTSILYSPN